MNILTKSVKFAFFFICFNSGVGDNEFRLLVLFLRLRHFFILSPLQSFLSLSLPVKEPPGCLFIRTFLPKSSYTLLHMLECLKLHASPLTSLICEIFMEISSYPCNCIYIYN